MDRFLQMARRTKTKANAGIFHSLLMISRSPKTPNPSRGSVKASKLCVISMRSVEIRCVFRGPSSKILFSIDSFNPAIPPLFHPPPPLLPLFASRSPIQSFRSSLPWTSRPSKPFFSLSLAINSILLLNSTLNPLLLLILLLLPQTQLQIRVQAPLLVRPFTFSLFLTILDSKTAPPISSIYPMGILPCINGTISPSRCRTSPTQAFSTNS